MKSERDQAKIGKIGSSVYHRNVSRRDFLRFGGIGLAGMAMVGAAGCGGQSNEQGSGKSYKGWTKDYSGTKLSYIGEATLNTQILQKLTSDFTNKTGVTVSMEQNPYDALVQKETLDFSTHQGSYDVVSLPYEYLGGFTEKNYIAPVKIPKVPGFDSGYIIPNLWKETSSWKGKYYGAPSNSAVMMMFYRKDLFNDPDEKAAFKKEYGRELAPALTWQQYRDIAEFFTRKKGEKLASKPLSQDFYGLTLAGKRHQATPLEWFNYAWTFGGGLFDKSGGLILNSPGSVAALAYEVSLTKFAPPGYTSTTWDEMTSAFQQGTVAQAIAWGDTAGSLEDPSQSRVAGKMGYASIPVKNEGDKPTAMLGSWTYAINPDSQNQEAGKLFIAWALSKPIQTKLATNGGLPALKPVFENPSLIKKLPYWRQELKSLNESRPRPRIPQWGGISDELALQISRALSGDLSPSQALDEAQSSLKNGVLKGVLPVRYQ